MCFPNRCATAGQEFCKFVNKSKYGFMTPRRKMEIPGFYKTVVKVLPSLMLQKSKLLCFFYHSKKYRKIQAIFTNYSLSAAIFSILELNMIFLLSKITSNVI